MTSSHFLRCSHFLTTSCCIIFGLPLCLIFEIDKFQRFTSWTSLCLQLFLRFSTWMKRSLALFGQAGARLSGQRKHQLFSPCCLSDRNRFYIYYLTLMRRCVSCAPVCLISKQIVLHFLVVSPKGIFFYIKFLYDVLYGGNVSVREMLEHSCPIF
jgi:hypothetical protein